ncbi:MAG TPA: hypothetical protein VEJ16_09865 [Alphaproteobacteria bacterium]|nr:hypothetical protein [Alphaproteobacteria bacterium]
MTVAIIDLDVVVETRNREHVQEILTPLDGAGYKGRLLSATATSSES